MVKELGGDASQQLQHRVIHVLQLPETAVVELAERKVEKKQGPSTETKLTIHVNGTHSHEHISRQAHGSWPTVTVLRMVVGFYRAVCDVRRLPVLRAARLPGWRRQRWNCRWILRAVHAKLESFCQVYCPQAL